MITAAEVAQGTYGAWRLARGDSDGLRYFGDTAYAFWRSFYAALIVAPAYLILVLLKLDQAQVTGGALHIFLIESMGYVIGWVAFPLVMIWVADSLDRWHRYFRYITAYNWAAVLQTLLFLTVSVLTHGGAMGAGFSVLLSLITVCVILTYQWYIARVALDISGAAAAGIVMMDFMLGIVINVMTSSAL